MENERSSPENLTSLIDHYLRKYVSVWLWSITFGGATGVSYSFLTLRADEPWGKLGLLLLALLIAGVLFTLLAWYYLLRFLTVYLLPIFFGSPESTTKAFDELAGARFERYLPRALAALVIAVLFRLALVAGQLLYYSANF